MLTDQCISVTDLRTKTKQCIDKLKEGEKYIFINNKPKAVLMDIDVYEKLFDGYVLKELPTKDISDSLLKKADKTRKMKSDEFVNL